MRCKLLLMAGLMVGGYGVLASSAQATVMYPGPYVGDDVTYSNVRESSSNPTEDPEPLFGDPSDPDNPEIIDSNTLDFDPIDNQFQASAPPTDFTDGALRFLLTSNEEGQNLTNVFFSESGDYTLGGTDPSGDFVVATLNATVKDPDTGDTVANGTAQFSKGFSNPIAETGNFQVDLNIPLADENVDEVVVELNNTLIASAQDGNAAFLRKKDFRIGSNVPVPGSLALMGIGTVLIGLRPSKKA